MSEGYQIISIKERVWAIQDDTVRMYLLNGKTASVLIDTGYGKSDLAAAVRPYASGKLRVINTHCHHDHISGNRQFHYFYMHERDRDEISQACPEDAVIETVKDGELITAGEISLEVIEIPGHTPGSIALLDRKDRLLFSADSFAKEFPIYMQFPGQDLKSYGDSIQKMMALSACFDRICPCHGEPVIEREYMGKTLNCVEKILSLGQIPEHTPEYVMRHDGVTILY